MDDAVIQHHFDEVFMALQDVGNFEVFTGAKKISTPKVHRTLVKIVKSTTETGNQDMQSNSEIKESISKLSSELKSTMYSSSNAFRSNTRPSSQVSTMRPNSRASAPSKLTTPKIGPCNIVSDTGKSTGLRKVHSSSLPKRKVNTELRNTLFECKNCGRFFLGDFLKTHEEKCQNKNL